MPLEQQTVTYMHRRRPSPYYNALFEAPNKSVHFFLGPMIFSEFHRQDVTVNVTSWKSVKEIWSCVQFA